MAATGGAVPALRWADFDDLRRSHIPMRPTVHLFYCLGVIWPPFWEQSQSVRMLVSRSPLPSDELARRLAPRSGGARDRTTAAAAAAAATATAAATAAAATPAAAAATFAAATAAATAATATPAAAAAAAAARNFFTEPIDLDNATWRAQAWHKVVEPMLSSPHFPALLLRCLPIRPERLTQLRRSTGRGLHSSTFRLAFCGIGLHVRVV